MKEKLIILLKKIRKTKVSLDKNYKILYAMSKRACFKDESKREKIEKMIEYEILLEEIETLRKRFIIAIQKKPVN